MRTLKDLEKMKNTTIFPFGNQYDSLFLRLEDFYLAKTDGLERIKAELQNWDEESQKIIVNELVDVISKRGISGFDKNELLELVNDCFIGGRAMIYCENCQRNQTDYCYKCKHGYYGSKDEEQNKRYDLSEYFRPVEDKKDIE